jgi:hypothetical protein
MHEQAAEQIARYAKGGAVVEGSRQRRPKLQRISTAKRMFFFCMPSSTMS